MLNGGGSGSWRLSLKLESSLCPGLTRQCPGACRLSRCVEAEKRTQFFAEGRVEAQVWREEEAGLGGGQQAHPHLEEVGCSTERNYLEILAIRSCVSLLGLYPSRLLSQETRAWAA